MLFCFFLAKRILKSKRTALSKKSYVLGIIISSVGNFFILLTVMFSHGFHDLLVEKITNIGGTKSIVKKTKGNYTNFNKKTAKDIIKLLYPYKTTAIRELVTVPIFIIDQSKSFQTTTLYGSPRKSWSTSNINSIIKIGRFFESIDNEIEITISNLLANKLQCKIGDLITFCTIKQETYYIKAKIVGIYDTHIEDINDKFAFCDIKIAQKLKNYGKEQIDRCLIFNNNKTLKEKIYNSHFSELSVISCEEEYSDLYDWLNIIKQNGYILTIIILIVIHICTLSIIMIQILEKLSLIKILKILGLKNSKIFFSFQIYCFPMGIGAYLLALFNAFIIFLLQSNFKIIKLNTEVYYTNYLPLTFPIRLIFIISISYIIQTSLINCLLMLTIKKVKPV